MLTDAEYMELRGYARYNWRTPQDIVTDRNFVICDLILENGPGIKAEALAETWVTLIAIKERYDGRNS